MTLQNRDIKYSRVTMKEPYGTRTDAAVVKSMLGITDTAAEIPQTLWDELNKRYRKGVRVAKAKRLFGKIAKVGAWYIGANIVIGIAIGIALLAGFDVIGWYTEVLGVNL